MLWTLLPEKILGMRMRAHGRREQKYLRDRISEHQAAEEALQQKDADAFKEHFVGQLEAMWDAIDEIEIIGNEVFQEENKVINWEEDQIDDWTRVEKYIREDENLNMTAQEKKELEQAFEESIDDLGQNSRKLLSWTARLKKGEKPINLSTEEILEKMQQEDTVAREIYNATWHLRGDTKDISSAEGDVSSAENEAEKAVSQGDKEALHQAISTTVEEFNELCDQIEEFENTQYKLFTYIYMELYQFLQYCNHVVELAMNNRGDYKGFPGEYLGVMEKKFREAQNRVEQVMERNFKDKIQRVELSKLQHLSEEVKQVAN